MSQENQKQNRDSFPDIIFVSLENWDEIWRRNQFLCAGFARRHPESRVLFVGPARNISHAIRRGNFKEIFIGLFKAESRAVPEYSNITLTQPLKLFPNSLSLGRCVNEVLMRRHVRRVAKRLQIQNSLLWLNPHDAVHMTGKMKEAAVIYDITDDWSQITQSPKLKFLTIRQDAELCRRADAVIVCSQQLLELKKPLSSNLHLIPNGVDAQHYAGVLDRSQALPEAAARWSKPVLGYTGTIHPDRVDVPLLEEIAKQLQSGTLVLIGPNHIEATEKQRFAHTGRVVFKDAIPYCQIPAYMRAFDVCITPHRISAFTESLNPIKLWEYLASGKPVVSTPVAGFRDFPDLVYLADDASTFIAAIEKALNEDASRCELRMKEAARHSWESRLNDVEAVIRDCLNHFE